LTHKEPHVNTPTASILKIFEFKSIVEIYSYAKKSAETSIVKLKLMITNHLN